MINRDYQLPGYVGRESLVIASSYSGDTEETLAAYQDAIRRGAWSVVLTTGGKLQEMVDRVKGDLIRIPPGLPPRQAFGYSFFMLLKFFQGKGWIADQSQAVAAAILELEKLREANSLNAKKSFTSELAMTLRGKIPFIYGSPRTTEAVALRWKQQFAENAKIHAFVNVLPEMNHNEIMGWGNQKELLKRSVVIFLEDPDDPPRIRTRQEITKKILGGLGIQIRSVASNAKERLSRRLGLIYLGDWTSYYLALLQKTDPIVINRIDYLKAQLTKK
jgi:glucose/mannose-6-phosphate isomerase